MDTFEFVLYVTLSNEISTYIERDVDLDLFILPNEC